MNESNNINLFAGRPGAGKTLWARNEIISRLRDPNSFVVYIGTPQEGEALSRKAEGLPGRLVVNTDFHAAQTIGMAIDAANVDKARFAALEESTLAQAEHCQVSLFFDQCRHAMFLGYRDLLAAAAKAGVSVNVLCQVFHQVDKNNLFWLANHCDCFIISKGRSPRAASKEEMEKIYR